MSLRSWLIEQLGGRSDEVLSPPDESSFPPEEREQRRLKRIQERALRRRQLGLGLFYIVLPIFLFYMLFKVFPPWPWPMDPVNPSPAAVASPSPSPSPGDTSPATRGDVQAAVKSVSEEQKAKEKVQRPFEMIYFLRGRYAVQTSLEERLLLLVIIAGALGSFIHASTSFADYVGNKDFAASWTWWYVLRPLVGISLALVIYFVIRGGLLLLVTGGGATEAKDVNPFGVAALTCLAGMFSKQATDKLNEVFSTIFKAAGDEKRKDSLSGPDAPKIAKIEPSSGSATGDDDVVITGSGFAEGLTLTFGGITATSIEVKSDTMITAKTPAHDVGKVDVVVTNKDKQTFTLSNGYEYLPTSPPFDTSPPL